ncbi:malonate decarboxylase holo-ACP synthase [Paraburkholderia sp. NMBU_R16]|nr:malonate decarboxylase holo-ACP synthase [Paraburkholderia sp. NMBU_R16]NRO95910.1 malonate decarboxylase holo-ACP synthase [Paraburkholderia sp. NMBU_R16]
MVRPHDLLKLNRSSLASDAPAWAHTALSRIPFAVVRRAVGADDAIPIGIRGDVRTQRYAAYANRQDIEAIVGPEQLLAASPSADRRSLGAFVALARLCAVRRLARYEWGPTGSAGFELATRRPTVSASSDLDLLVRAPDEMAPGEAAALMADIRAEGAMAGARIDVQLETPAGAIALSEWAAAKPRTMLRTPNGPCLVDNPWSAQPLDLSPVGGA